MARQLIAGNWKMNGLRSDGVALAAALVEKLGSGEVANCDWLVCPPASLLAPVAEALKGSGIALGGQDCHSAASGAHTGEIAAAMLADAGCSHVIVGHSERRSDHGESSELVRAKAEAALTAGLIPVVCVGETAEQRQAGQALAVIEAQVQASLPAEGHLILAYEPVWAIGTGLTATPEDVAEVHSHIHDLLTGMRGDAAGHINILYGGSVKSDNAADLLSVPHVGGALVGGASLKAADFWAIGASCP